MISLPHSATAALVNVVQNARVTGLGAARWGTAHPNLVPYELFEAADRPVVIAMGRDSQIAACARVLGLRGLAADPSLATTRGGSPRATAWWARSARCCSHALRRGEAGVRGPA